uniref:Uncharacterized protein n=1 Tax=Onchocerca volvulus TaxID=6282 RepID=A0A8R1XUZ3_ONCVO
MRSIGSWMNEVERVAIGAGILAIKFISDHDHSDSTDFKTVAELHLDHINGSFMRNLCFPCYSIYEILLKKEQTKTVHRCAHKADS